MGGTVLVTGGAGYIGSHVALALERARYAPLIPANVYGRTKRTIEVILEQLAASDPSWRIGLLRYFNPAGADESGEIGEAPSNAPNNLVPILAEVAAGRRSHIDIFGNDYPT